MQLREATFGRNVKSRLTFLIMFQSDEHTDYSVGKYIKNESILAAQRDEYHAYLTGGIMYLFLAANLVFAY